MENSKSDLTGFLIQDGKFEGVMYTYGKVTIEENDKLRLKFEYNVHEVETGVIQTTMIS